MVTPTVGAAVALRHVLISFFAPLKIQGFAHRAPRASSPPDAPRLLVRSVSPRAGRAVEAAPVNPRRPSDGA